MTTVQLLIEDDANRDAVGELLSRGGYTYTTGSSLQDADLFVVDDYSLPQYRDALRAEQRDRHPAFCPVVLVHRESTRVDLTPGDDATDEPRLIDETVVAPVTPSVFFRRISNLLVRQRQTEELAERNERLDEFAGKLSHELRNPLNVLEGRLELARETGDDTHFEEMERSLGHVRRLVDDVLSLARTGDVSVDPAPVSLPDAVNACWESVGTQSASLEVDASGPVVADEDRLRQALSNLLRNAVEHGGSDVTVTVGDLPDGFYVADDGPGIPEADRDDAFDSGYSTDSGGTGLGLSVVSEVASAHDWTVEYAESESGGARFEFRGVDRPTDPD